MTHLSVRRQCFALAALAVLALGGCARIDLYTNLSEQQANEVAAVLIAAEIDADKRVSESKAWSVLIDKSDLPRAMDVLETSGVPKTAAPTMAEVFRKDGFISSPLEERARFIAATSQDLQQTILHMNGVLDARVHLALPERDPLSDVVVPPSASVFIKYAENAKFNESGGMANVKSIVRDAVEGLSVDRITVVATPTLGSWRHTVRPPTSKLADYAYQKPLLSPTVWLAIALAAVLAAIGAAWWTRDRWWALLLQRFNITRGTARPRIG
jgi:type III secretion protein J